MGIGVDDVDQLCLECGRRCCNRRSLGNHVNRSHKELGGLLGYLLKHVLVGVVPKCLCGCGKEVHWHKVCYRFNDYLTGHNPSSLAGYLVRTLQVAHKALKPGCRCVLNVSSDLVDLVEASAVQVGFVRRADLDDALPVGRDHFAKKKGVGSDIRVESIIVFEKPIQGGAQ